MLGRYHADGMLHGTDAVLEHMPAPDSGLTELARATGYRHAAAVSALFRSHLLAESAG